MYLQNKIVLFKKWFFLNLKTKFKQLIYSFNKTGFSSIKNLLKFLLERDNQDNNFLYKLKIQYLKQYENALNFPKSTYDNVKYFVIFICNPRTGHTLIGSLLDAHPNIVISHETRAISNLVFSDFNSLLVNNIILSSSYKMGTDQDRFQTNYDYNIPYEYTGRYKELKIIGDKQGALTSEFLRKFPKYINEILKFYGQKLRCIHVIRNPYDSIARISFNKNFTMTDAIYFYFNNVELFHKVRKLLTEDQVIILRHEDFIDKPKESLKKLCANLGLDAPDDYLNACSSIIYKKPHSRRYEHDWKQEDLNLIERFMKMKRYSEYFKRYQF